ncbi:MULTISPECIES: SLC13 family permease [Thermoanaerobacter]|uniref:Citrate transporter n=2 Tax=Thermoanaerobacter TaxID=1754 RepID=B0K9J7_THEP3|nr:MULTISPECIES: SLC13 family permease [Thermoanaerobacter]ABY94810.1 Citrate transporter [Thermoanaerobacter pseudethanolicus ATCC 33223]ADV79759.1 Citrate transporter [Thermoanaerobacter brockii subsp. finnii Ako-1]HBW58786.1 arsenic transporter [Thermoanaerobacter sp.]
MKLIAILIFIATYILLLVLPKYRTYISLFSALLFVLIGILPFQKALSYIDWNVILMIGGTMGIVNLFIESKMPALMADVIIDKVASIKWAIISLAAFAGIVSAFIDNVATVLIIAPVAMDIAKKLNISPVYMIISIAISSNLQGAATLVGDTTSLLLGGYAKMDFIDFFFFKGRMGLFWIVQIGAVATIPILLLFFREYNQPIHLEEKQEVEDYFPSYLLILMVALLIIASFIPNKPEITNGLICTTLLLIGIIKEVVISKNKHALNNTLLQIDYETILLLMGLFVVIGGISEVGVINDISKIFSRFGKGNLFLIYTIIVWFSVFVSAFIDNIPYTATMLPVVSKIAQEMGIQPYLLYFGLLVGATLGGNITPIGASANITGLGILRKEGYEVKAKDFMKLSIPFTLTAVITGYILTWIIWR